MNKHSIDEKPLQNIERNPLLVISAIVSSAILCVLTWYLFEAMSPWGFLVAVPAVVITLQTAWMLMNPFAMVFDGRLEIKQSWFQHKDRYFNDLDKVSKNKKGEVFLTYTDGEVEKLNVFGIKPGHRNTLVECCDRQVRQTLATRA